MDKLNLKNCLKNSNFYLAFFKIKYRKLYAEKRHIIEKLVGLEKKLNKNGCMFIFVFPPNAAHIRSLDPFERERLKNWVFDFNNISESDAEIIKKLYDGISLDYIMQVYDGAKVIQFENNKRLVDFQSKYVNIVNGIRLTTDQPEKFQNRIHLYGACTIRGTGVEDAHTISSLLQKKVNSECRIKYQCVNHGIGCGSTIIDDIYNIENTVFYRGDVVVLCNMVDPVLEKMLIKSSLMTYDTSEIFERPHPWGNWFTDTTPHTNKNGNQAIADYIYKILISQNYFNRKSDKKVLVGCLNPNLNNCIEWTKTAEYKNYLNYLKENKKNNNNNNGGIVMNCNPFTNGHRYLIEWAALQVEQLYIFVVEENKSFFTFEDRYDLVVRGTADLKNVTVLKSGQFIISATTFPGYFYKDNDKNAIVDTSKDVDMFGKYIAPILGISTRFVGDEPLDPITNQYNNTLRERLPMLGIDLKILKRKETNSEVVSASRVRAALKNGDWDCIKTLVPNTTFNYLWEKYGE